MELILISFLALILTVGIGIGIKMALRFVFYELAKEDTLFTLRTEGEIKAIMEGDRCIGYIMAVENHIIDPDDFDIFKGTFEEYGRHLKKEAVKTTKARKKKDPSFVFTENKLKGKDDKLNEEFEERLRRQNPQTDAERNWVERWFGVVWVGFPPRRVFTYWFRWIKYSQKKGRGEEPSGEVGMQPKEELVHSLYFRYPTYGIVIDDAETGAGSIVITEKESDDKPPEGTEPKKEQKVLERIKIKLELVMETVTVNPHKTLFRTAGLSSAGDWISAISKEIRDQVRPWVGQQDYDTFIKDKEGIRKSLDRIRDRVNGFLPDGYTPYKPDSKAGEGDPVVSTIRDYGQRIVKLDLVNVDLEKKLQDEIDNIFKAEQEVRKSRKERDAAVIRAVGARATAAGPLLGKADGLKEIAKIPDGANMYKAEQLGNIHVYAPGGQDRIFLNVPTEGTEKKDTPTLKEGNPE